MALVFDWVVHVGTSGKTALRALEAKFGDGYSQATQDGINSRVKTWNVHLTVPYAVATDVAAFLDAHDAWVSFLWTPPNGEQGYYRCAEYSENPHGADYVTITAEFKQAFHP